MTTTVSGEHVMGNSTKEDNLIDCLLPCIDDIRGDIHGDMGTRAYRVFFVKRCWSGGEVGEGRATDTEEECLPRPLVHPFTSMRYQQEPCGLDEAGGIKITEVSLCYNAHDILSCEAPDGCEYLIKISEGWGQGNPDRYFVYSKPPYVDRIKTIGWILYLEHVETGECP